MDVGTMQSSGIAAHEVLGQKGLGLGWTLSLRDVGTEKRGCDEEGDVQRMRRAKTCRHPTSKIQGR